MPRAPFHDRLATVPDAEAYVAELREFFLSRQIPCADDQDVSVLALRLAKDPSFADETASMVRSFLYREAETLSAEDLCPLVIAAVAGTTYEPQASTKAGPHAQLLAFVRAIMRPQALSSDGAPGVDDESDLPEAAPDSAPLGYQPSAPTDARHALMSDPRGQALQRPINQRFSEMLFASAPAIELSTKVEAQHTVRALPLDKQDASTEPEEGQPSASFHPVSLPPFWFASLAMLLLALLIACWTIYHAAVPVSIAKITFSPPGENAAVHGDDSGPVLPSPSPATPHSTHPRSAKGSTRQRAVPGSLTRGGNGVFLTSSGTMAGHLVSAPAPGYPKLASLTRTQGQVVLQVMVTRFGLVGSTRVLDGPYLLRGAAEYAVRQWRYRPFVTNGQATAVSTMVTVTFRLQP